MPKVTNLTIKQQTDSDTYFATWSFDNTVTTTTTSSGDIKKGDLCTIKSGATYYNGAHIPTWVMNDSWYVIQVKGNRAVLGKNASGSNDITSAINTAYLSNGSSGTTTTTTTTNHLDHYTVKWQYDTGDGVWFSGGESDTEEKYATYSAPDNALVVRCTVTPVSETYTVNDNETSYWTGTAVSADHTTSTDPPDDISTPDVEIEKYKLTASLENISDGRCDEVSFEVYNDTTLANTGIVTVVLSRASFSCTVVAGGEYRVRARAINLNGTSRVYGNWSDFSTKASTIPSTPTGITTIKAMSETSVYLEWDTVTSATSYEIEYATEKRYFDGSDSTSSVSGIESTHYEKTGLETGDEYFFRVRATNDNGSSGWSDIQSVIIGKDPAAPTTWASTTTVITGEKLILYWVHNAEDNSSQTYAELELTINGEVETKTIKNTTDEDEKDKTSSYEIDTSSYTEGTKILWRVRTAGVTNSYGDWSVQRTVDIYAPPTLSLNMVDKESNAISTLNSFPFYVSAFAGPKTQTPIGYSLSISAKEGYETTDSVGNSKTVNADDEVYSKYFDTNDQLMVELSANNVDLENGITYTISCTVSMNSGLTATATKDFKVVWADESYEPNAELALDTNTYTTYITPYCRNENNESISGILLAVYRKQFDGTYVEIASGLDNTKNTVVTDPHPALDYARYRIVATTESTGAVSYYDIPGYPISCKSVIIQWAEEWTNFYSSNKDAMVQPPWSGSMLKLPYNIDVSDNHSIDVSLIEYIGRSHPISYYGTQLGETSSWSVAIDKSDKETLYALRRLAIYTGDVYVREPSGSGYWANVSVSFSQTHCELTIPVSLDITRVEGGV